jgi:hypothetical protein
VRERDTIAVIFLLQIYLFSNSYYLRYSLGGGCSLAVAARRLTQFAYDQLSGYACRVSRITGKNNYAQEAIRPYPCATIREVQG